MMHTLHIELQEGFQDETVVILVNGSEILHQDHVKTRTQIGFAAASTATVAAGKAALDVVMPAADVRAPFEADIQADTWIGVSLDGARALHFKTSLAPFGYV